MSADELLTHDEDEIVNPVWRPIVELTETLNHLTAYRIKWLKKFDVYVWQKMTGNDE